MSQLKMITSKNREAVVARINQVVGQKSYIVDRKPEGLVVVTQDNEKYQILVEYDQTGKSVYLLKRIYTVLEKAQQEAEAWTAEGALEDLKKKVGTVDQATEKVNKEWAKLDDDHQLYSASYRIRSIAEARGIELLTYSITSTIEYLEKKTDDAREILEGVRTILHKELQSFSTWSHGANSTDLIGLEIERTTKAASAYRAQDLLNELNWLLKEIDRAQLNLINTKNEE